MSAIAYRRDIDGLRALAVVPVLLFHFGVPLVSGGFTGVDVFFVISGYVIALSLLADLERGQFSIAGFYYKRIRRILPALAATVLATTVAAVALLLPYDLVGYGKSVIAVAAFVSNIFFWKDSGYFAAAAQLKPLLHTWSLSVEEQYYIVMPLAVAVIHGRLGGRWRTVLLPVLIASFVLSVVATTVAPTANFFLLPTRVWELLLGALLALAPPPVPGRKLGELAGALGLAAIIAGMLLLEEGKPFPGLNALYPCIGAALIIYGGGCRDDAGRSLPLASRILSLPPMVWIGLISYSLYLVHWPIAVMVRTVTLRNPEPGEAVAMLIASVLLASLSWRFIERPFRQRRIGRATMLGGGAAILVAMAALGGVLVAGRGFPSRTPEFVQREIPGFEQWRAGSCFNTGGNDLARWSRASCTRTTGTGPAILLWGDSFAAQYVPGIIANQQTFDRSVIQYTYAGCPPMLTYQSYARASCTEFNRRAIALVQAGGIDTVVLAGRWTDYERRGFDGLQSTIEALRKTGVRVFVIGQSPQFTVDVQQIAFKMRHATGSDRDTWTLAFDPAINIVVKAASRGATFIDPLPVLCDGSRCRYRDHGTYLFADYGHFSVEGSKRAVGAYFPGARGKAVDESR